MVETIRVTKDLYKLLQYLKYQKMQETGEFVSYDDIISEALKDEDDEYEDNQQDDYT